MNFEKLKINVEEMKEQLEELGQQLEQAQENELLGYWKALLKEVIDIRLLVDHLAQKDVEE